MVKAVVVTRSWLRAQVVVEPTLEVELIRLRVLAKVLEVRVMAMDLDRELAKA